jgi:hypothetical protein
MKTLNIILFIFILTSCNSDKTPDRSFDSLKKDLQDLGICINVSEQTWKDSVLLVSKLSPGWRYFCDSNYFKVHKISKDLGLDKLFLLEAKIGHGSGEYDNFIIQKTQDKYEIKTEFKGYLDTIIPSDNEFELVYNFKPEPDKSCKVTGHFNGQYVITDTVLTYFNCRNFSKGQKWE